VVLVCSVAVLVACDDERDTAAAVPKEAAAPVRDLESPPREKLPPPAEQPQIDAAAETPEIDLSLSPDILTGDDNPAYLEPNGQNVLPNLFDKPGKQQKTRIDAELFRDEDNPDYLDSIEGMNVIIERKLGD